MFQFVFNYYLLLAGKKTKQKLFSIGRSKALRIKELDQERYSKQSCEYVKRTNKAIDFFELIHGVCVSAHVSIKKYSNSLREWGLGSNGELLTPYCHKNSKEDCPSIIKQVCHLNGRETKLLVTVLAIISSWLQNFPLGITLFYSL